MFGQLSLVLWRTAMEEETVLDSADGGATFSRGNCWQCHRGWWCGRGARDLLSFVRPKAFDITIECLGVIPTDTWCHPKTVLHLNCKSHFQVYKIQKLVHRCTFPLKLFPTCNHNGDTSLTAGLPLLLCSDSYATAGLFMATLYSVVLVIYLYISCLLTTSVSLCFTYLRVNAAKHEGQMQCKMLYIGIWMIRNCFLLVCLNITWHRKLTVLHFPP